MGATDLLHQFGAERQVESDEIRHWSTLRVTMSARERSRWMATVRHERRIAAPADAVWEVLRRPEDISRWFPGVTNATMDGNIRTITLASGLSLPEEILTIDDLLRRVQYRITSPLYTFHLGTIDVIALTNSESLCVYSTTAEPPVLALVVGGATVGALEMIDRLATLSVGSGV
jgi:hypothetical protein